MRASRLQLFRRFAHEDPNAPFHEKCGVLKNKFRGKGQFRASQHEATAFLDANVGKNLEEWLTVRNAVAALSVMSFFEIEHPYKAEMAHWLNNKVSSLTVQEKLDVGGVLVGADHAKYVDTVVANIINPLVRHGVPGMTPVELSIFCKIMQRCGNSCPTEAWTTVATQVQRKLTADVSLGELVRFFSGFARRIPDSPVTLAILRSLVENGRNLKAFDYSTVINSAGRLHLTNPIPLDLFSKAASYASEFEAYLNARDTGNILATIMRVRSSYKATPETINELWKVDNTIQVVLHTLSRNVVRYMDPNDERYWSSETDIVALVFAYESSGGKFPEIFKAFNEFVKLNIRKMEARNVALSLGILRRTGFLTEELARALSDRCGALMDDFNAPELSHVVFTFMAVRGEYPQWLDRAKSRISSLMTPETPVHAKLNIQAAFPGENALVSNVDLSQVSLRQLYDVLRAPNIDADLRSDAEKQLAIAIAAVEAPSCAEVEALVAIGTTDFCGLGEGVKEVARKILARDQWPVDIGALASLFDAAERAEYAKKAAISAAAYCESPTQFISFADTLLSIFPDSMDVRDWVVRGATELAKPRAGTFISTTIAVLNLIKKYKVDMGTEWYTAVLYGPISENASRLSMETTAVVLEMLQVLGIPSSHGEPVTFLLQQACERSQSAEKLVPVFVAAAKLKCAPLDEGWLERILNLPNLSEEDKALLSQCEKTASSVKSLSRQQHSSKVVEEPKKIVVSGANSGRSSHDAMTESFEEEEAAVAVTESVADDTTVSNTTEETTSTDAEAKVDEPETPAAKSEPKKKDSAKKAPAGKKGAAAAKKGKEASKKASAKKDDKKVEKKGGKKK